MSFVGMKKEYVETNMGKVAVYKKNLDSDKQTLLFLHGVFLSHNIWSDYVAAFEKQYNVIALDWFGHGESDSPAKGWAIEDSVSALQQVIDALKLSNVILVGHSWGGMASLRYSDKHAEKVKALVLFNTPMGELSPKVKLLHRLQMMAMPFKGFYGKQAASSIYSENH